MKFRIVQLAMKNRQSLEAIDFADFSYFHGPMGSGKTSIARLVDYCLGGRLDLAPALQSEFIWAELSLLVEGNALTLHREKNSEKIRAQWQLGNEPYELVIPARTPAGEVLPDTGVEVLSDLIFHLAGKKPPRVRLNKSDEDSDLGRLSVRNLLWYCYLDQDSIDSSFFHLDEDAGAYKRLASRDVLRFVVGFYQERLSELQVQLDNIKIERVRLEAASDAIKDAITEAELGSEIEASALRRAIEASIAQVDHEISASRDEARRYRTHASERLRTEARRLGEELESLEQTVRELRESASGDKSHRNELLNLGTRFRRQKSARAILKGVEFKDCPSCSQALPSRPADVCPVCGQPDAQLEPTENEEKAAQTDLDARISELDDLITRQERQIARLTRQGREIADRKRAKDEELIAVSAEYDSAVLSGTLDLERRRAALGQQLLDLAKIEALIRRIDDFEQRAKRLIGQEAQLRAQMREARQKAERDAENLGKLKDYFLDCLVRARIPGIFENDVVEMPMTNLQPIITSAEGGLTTTSFHSISSGGKKTLFKCCFAIALHRLATEIKAALPTLLIIDSPMKNISERENRAQYERFHTMLYELADGELSETQFVLIDKEFIPPPDGFGCTFAERYMTPDDDQHPPLISYYRGK